MAPPVTPHPIEIGPEFIGQEPVCARLLQAIGSGRLSRSILLSGPKGSGRKTLAYRLAAGFADEGCFRAGFEQNRGTWPSGVEKATRLLEQGAHPDLILLRPEGAKQEITAKAARSLQQFVSTTPALARGKVAIVENANALNPESANAILKVLEEPKVSFALVLIADNPMGLLPTIRSRCVQFKLDRLSDANLSKILAQNGASLSDKARALADGDADLALTLAASQTDLSGLDAVLDFLHSPSSRLLPSAASPLVALEKSLGSDIVVRLVFQALRSSMVGTATGSTWSSDAAALLPMIQRRFDQRGRLSLDSTATWMDALRQLHVMMDTQTNN